MRIVFRVDASPTIGVGHVMRCSAIIEEAVSRNIECVVVGSFGGIDWLITRLKSIGATHFEDEKTFQMAAGQDILVIDSYNLPITDQFIHPSKWRLIVSISDETTPNYLANLIIHPSITNFPQVAGRARLITGTNYIPFRKSIQKSVKSTSTTVGKIIVFGGGSDPFNFATFMAQRLARNQNFKSAIFFSNSDSEIRSLDSRFKVLSFGPLLDMELENTELVFTTASSSSLEVIAREIPLGVCCVAENQVAYYEALTKNHLAAGIGKYNPAGGWEIDWSAVTALLSDSNLRRNFRENTKGYIDLLGSHRIVDEILDLIR